MKAVKPIKKRFMVALPYDSKKRIKDMANAADCSIAELILTLISQTAKNGKKGGLK